MSASSENTLEAQAKQQDVNLPKNFSKIRLFQMLGLFSRKLNCETFELERSLTLRLWCLLSLISKLLFGVKLYLSYYFPANDAIQLQIGSVFNYLPPEPKFFLGVMGIIAACWSVQWHFTFNYLNAKEDFRLFKFWMKLTNELPEKSIKDCPAAGLSQEENKFWSTENSVNRLWFRAMNYYLTIQWLLFCSGHFLVQFDGVEPVSANYLLFQALHLLHDFHTIFSLGHCTLSINLFYVECMWFFSRRFESLGKRVERLNAWKTFDGKKNRKLTRLVIEYNRLHYDLIQINEFFRNFVGFSLISSFACAIDMAFLEMLDIDWRSKMVLLTPIIFLYLIVICLPFVIASSVTTQINKTKHRFENIAFSRLVSKAIKQKIELISNLSDKAGFTCFDWFLLDSHTALKISLEFVVYLLLLIQASYYMTMF